MNDILHSEVFKKGFIKITNLFKVPISIAVACYFSIGDYVITSFNTAVVAFMSLFIIFIIVIKYNKKEFAIRQAGIKFSVQAKMLEVLSSDPKIDPARMLINMYITNQKQTRSILVTDAVIHDFSKTRLELSDSFISDLIEKNHINKIDNFKNKLSEYEIKSANKAIDDLSKPFLDKINLPRLVHYIAHLMSLSLLNGTWSHIVYVMLINMGLVVSYYIYLKLYTKGINSEIKITNENFNNVSLISGMLTGFIAYINIATNYITNNKTYNEGERMIKDIDSKLNSLNDFHGDSFITQLLNTIDGIVTKAGREITLEHNLKEK